MYPFYFRVFDIKVGKLKVDQDSFLSAVGNLLFRGTSSLFRFIPEVSFSTRSEKIPSMKDSDDSGKNIWRNADEVNCDYVLAVHSVKVHNQGIVANVRPIWEDIKNTGQLGLILYE